LCVCVCVCVSLAVLFCLNGMGNENKQPITELKRNTIFSTHMINNYFLRPKKHGFSVVLSQTILSLAKFVKKSIKIYHIKDFCQKKNLSHQRAKL